MGRWIRSARFHDYASAECKALGSVLALTMINTMINKCFGH